MKTSILLALAGGLASEPTALAQTVSSPQPITLPAQGVASFYPSTITVSGFTGVVRRVAVTLSNVVHGSLPDLNALLVGPQGTNVQLLSGVAAPQEPVNGATWTFTDFTTNYNRPGSTSGTFKPMGPVGSLAVFPPPAPPVQEALTGYNRLSIFRGMIPNGDWSVYLYDSVAGNGGSVEGGWSLTIDQDPLIIPTASNPNTILILDVPDGRAAPYPSIILVSNLTGVVSKVTVTLSNLVHASGADLDVLLVGPSGQAVFVLGEAGEPEDNTEWETVTFDDAASGPLPGNIRSGTFQPTVTYTEIVPFPTPAPAPPYPAQLSALRGTLPNGVWSLFVYDRWPDHGGLIHGGWGLRIETGYPLTIRRWGSNLRLNWPVAAQGYVLQSTARLDSPVWTAVSASRFVEGDQNVTCQPIVATSQYYRLFKQ